MTTLVVELQPEVYQRLEANAKQSETTPADWAANWLSSQLQPVKSDRERVREALRAAGLLTELGPELQKRAKNATMSLTEVQEALDQAGGKPLSELIIEMRGPKA